MRSIHEWLRLWFTFDRPVGRREYLISGVLLAALKYTGDVYFVWLSTGRIWRLTDYLSPLSSLVTVRLREAPQELFPVLALWALPFLWIGVSMSMRRALDAGLSAWLALFFFIPGANYVFMALMCLVPSRPGREMRAGPPRHAEQRLPRALLSMAAGIAVGLATIAFSVYGIRSYRVSLFLGTPFVVGAVTAFLFNRGYPAGSGETQQVVIMTLGCIAGVLLLTAAEGAICLLMSAPLGVVIGSMGSALGRRIALLDRGSPQNAWIAIALVPASALVDADRPPTALREVRSSIVINAPKATVWQTVISFPPLADPSELVFRAGIAYPKRAEIRGEGVGAIRYCVFSTGAFVEPITHWEPERRLSFDVAAQPPPLEEWSPYADVAPPHLDGYFRSRRGEFRVVPLPDGRTRLEGSTWYEMQLGPAVYWQFFGDALIGRIHDRVLKHIRALAERRSLAGRGSARVSE